MPKPAAAGELALQVLAAEIARGGPCELVPKPAAVISATRTPDSGELVPKPAAAGELAACRWR